MEATIYFEGPGVTVWHGDCLDVMRAMPDDSVHSIVTDPPYGLEFMGSSWDAPWKRGDDINADAGMSSTGYSDGGRRLDRPSFTGSTNPKCMQCGGTRRGRRDGTAKVAVCLCENGGRFPNVRAAEMRAFQDWCSEWTAEALRVLKPGGHLVAFGGSRTWHRLAVAVEDAGFELRDSIAWLYAQGFPKSLRVSRDERYCHCDASVHTSSGTSPAPQHDDHTRTEASEALAAGGAQSAPRATSAPLDSPDDCRPALGSGDALPHPAGVNDPTSAQPQGCAQARSRSGGREGGPDAGSSRTPSPARRNGHPSSRDSAPLADSQTSGSTHKLASTSPAGTSESAHHTPGTSLDPSYLYGTGFPVCGRCHKPNVDGLGTALKPAFEPIVCARKPLAGTVAANVLEHGTGALNIDATRIATSDDLAPAGGEKVTSNTVFGSGLGVPSGRSAEPAGRWPTNVVLDESQAAALDEQSGTLASGVMRAGTQRQARDGAVYGRLDADATPRDTYGASGGTSRFFPTFRYEAKAPSSERPEVDGVQHETVKPLALMRWLVRLVTPPGGTVLEPFAGSGTTLEAALAEGFDVIGVELTAEYLPLIRKRLTKPIDVAFDLGDFE